MRRRIVVQFVHTYNLVIGTRSQVSSVGGKAHGVDGTGMIAHGGQLLGLGVIWICGIVNGVGGPYSNVAICQTLVSFSKPVDERRVKDGAPPAAVASLVPSGET